MPAESRAQQRFMGRLLRNPRERERLGIPLTTARDFAKVSPRHPIPERVGKEAYRVRMHRG